MSKNFIFGEEFKKLGEDEQVSIIHRHLIENLGEIVSIYSIFSDPEALGKAIIKLNGQMPPYESFKKGGFKSPHPAISSIFINYRITMAVLQAINNSAFLKKCKKRQKDTADDLMKDKKKIQEFLEYWWRMQNIGRPVPNTLPELDRSPLAHEPVARGLLTEIERLSEDIEGIKKGKGRPSGREGWEEPLCREIGVCWYQLTGQVPAKKVTKDKFQVLLGFCFDLVEGKSPSRKLYPLIKDVHSNICADIKEQPNLIKMPVTKREIKKFYKELVTE